MRCKIDDNDGGWGSGAGDDSNLFQPEIRLRGAVWPVAHFFWSRASHLVGASCLFLL